MVTEENAIKTIELIVSCTKTDIIAEDTGLFKSFGDKLDEVFLALVGSVFGDDEQKDHFFHSMRKLTKQ